METRERNQGEWKFKQLQHKDDHGQRRTTHWDEDKDNWNNSNTKMIMANITPHIEMRTKVIYSFKSMIHRGAGENKDYNKTLTSPPGMFASLKEIESCIEECEQKRLDLDNEEV